MDIYCLRWHKSYPVNQVCVVPTGPYTIKAKDKTTMDFSCLTVIDPETSWIEIVELPNKDITHVLDRDKETSLRL